jgi:CubicO group peptidase (beta-lactamase class C family)
MALMGTGLTSAQAAPVGPDLAALVAALVRGNGDPTRTLAGCAVRVFSTRGRLAGAAAGHARFSRGQRAGLAMREDTPVRIASVSKLVTAIGAWTLASQGRLDLGEDVSDLVGFRVRNPAFPDQRITLAMVLAHTSSLRDGETYWAPYPGTLAALFEGTLATGRWGSEAPGYFTYCNLNYGLAAQAIERATGERFDLWMGREVLGPARAPGGFNWSGTSTAERARAGTLYRRFAPDGTTIDPFGTWTPQVDEAPESLAAPTFIGAEGASLADYGVGTNGTLLSPQGGLRISVAGLAALGRHLLGARGWPAAGVREGLRQPVWRHDGTNGATDSGFFGAYSAGAHLLPGGRWGHFGDAYGLRSGLVLDPALGRGVAYAITGFSSAPEPGFARHELAILRAALPGFQTDAEAQGTM